MEACSNIMMATTSMKPLQTEVMQLSDCRPIDIFRPTDETGKAASAYKFSSSSGIELLWTDALCLARVCGGPVFSVLDCQSRGRGSSPV